MDIQLKHEAAMRFSRERDPGRVANDVALLDIRLGVWVTAAAVELAVRNMSPGSLRSLAQQNVDAARDWAVGSINKRASEALALRAANLSERLYDKNLTMHSEFPAGDAAQMLSSMAANAHDLLYAGWSPEERADYWEDSEYPGDQAWQAVASAEGAGVPRDVLEAAMIRALDSYPH